ncbi:MAG: acyltransferase [Myxococcales bacterium]
MLAAQFQGLAKMESAGLGAPALVESTADGGASPRATTGTTPISFAALGQRLPALDGLRGLAVLAVVGFHGGAPLTAGGFIGVDVFFVLSGFLITSIIATEQLTTGSINLRNFYMRRVLRLAPALLLLLAVYAAGSIAFSKTASRNLIDALITLFYATNWARAYSLHAPLDLGHTWSLSIEEQFYLTWPLLLGLLLRRLGRVRTQQVALGLAGFAWLARAALVFAGSTELRIYSGLDTHADGLLLGCALALAGVTDNARKTGRVLPSYAPAVALVVLCAFLLLGNWKSREMFLGGFAAVNIAAATLIASIALGTAEGPASRILSLLRFRPLIWVGTISYGVYLWHYPIFRMLKALGFSRWPRLGIGVTLTFALASLSFYLLEQPALRMKKRFELRRSAVP